MAIPPLFLCFSTPLLLQEKAAAHYLRRSAASHSLHRLTGFELAKKILLIPSDLPAILCAGCSETIGERKAKNVGMGERVMKPVILRGLAGL